MHVQAMRLTAGDSGPGRVAHSALLSAMMLALLTGSTNVEADASLYPSDMIRVLEVDVAHFYQSKVRRRPADAACYFDPNVERSMSCVWHSYEPGPDSFFVQQEVRKKALQRCKNAGGISCVLFYRNGKLRFDGPSTHMTRKLESILSRVPAFLSEARRLPEGAAAASELHRSTARERSFWDERRKARRGHNLHYAICANEGGTWASLAMEGRAKTMRHVTRMCMLKCQAVAEWYSSEGPCYVAYENGRAVSAPAQRGVAAE